MKHIVRRGTARKTLWSAAALLLVYALVGYFVVDAAVGRPSVAFNRHFVDLELVSLVRWAWTFADVQLDGLQVNAEIGRDGRFNLAELAERWSKARPRDPDYTPRASLHGVFSCAPQAHVH